MCKKTNVKMYSRENEKNIESQFIEWVWHQILLHFSFSILPHIPAHDHKYNWHRDVLDIPPKAVVIQNCATSKWGTRLLSYYSTMPRCNWRQPTRCQCPPNRVILDSTHQWLLCVVVGQWPIPNRRWVCLVCRAL